MVGVARLLNYYFMTDGKMSESNSKGDSKMRTRALVLVAAFMTASAAATVFAADSMKHDMQRDLHVRMGMAAGEEKTVAPVGTKTVTIIKHDMQSDLHAKLGMTADDSTQNATTVYNAPTDAGVYRP